MSEMDPILAFLENSSKGKLEYDRDWAQSKDGIDRVLTQLSSNFDKILIEEDPDENVVRARMPENAAKSSLDSCEAAGQTSRETMSRKKTPDTNTLDSSIRSFVTTTPTQSPLSSRTTLATNKASSTTPRSPMSEPNYLSPRDGMTPFQRRLHLLDSALDAVTPSRPSDCARATRSPLILHNTRTTSSPLTKVAPMQRTVHHPVTPDISDLQTPPKEKLFGPRPLQVNVNRSTERSIENKQFIFDSETSSPNSSFSEVKKSDSTVFMYNKGFLSKVSRTPVSVDLVKLKLESVKELLGLDEDEVSDTTSSHSGEVTDDADDLDMPDPASLEIDRKLVRLREDMRAEAERKNAELAKKFKEKSAELSEEAERAYREEVDRFAKQQDLEERNCLEQRQRIREEAERRQAVELEDIVKKKGEIDELLRICREQEDKIKAEVAREGRIKEQVPRFEAILPGLKNSIVRLLDVWANVPDKTKLSDESKSCVSLEKEFCSLVDDLKEKAATGDATDADWSELSSLESKIHLSIKVLEKDLADIKKMEQAAALEAEKAAAEAEAAAAAAAKKAAEAKAAEADQTPAAVTNVAGAASTVPGQARSLESVNTTANQLPSTDTLQSPEAFYRETIDFKVKFVENIAFSDQEKKVKSDLTLAISTSLNAISSLNEQHLNDKLVKLASLLAGQPVTLKDAQISAGQHPVGISYCKALLAKKLVRQGEEVVSSKAETAFPFASVALALWDVFPDFGKLLLAYFFEFCPYLAPFYPVRSQGQSDKDFYLALGYKYEKDVVEKQDKFLKRMTGLARLFAAIAASSKAPGSGAVHPFGPKMIWQYIANLLNKEPMPDVTATILLVVLEVTGNLMLAKYGLQFLKLLVFIQRSFLPRLEAVKTDAGPTVRLETFINDAVNQRRIPSPSGILASGFIKKINV